MGILDLIQLLFNGLALLIVFGGTLSVAAIVEKLARIFTALGAGTARLELQTVKLAKKTVKAIAVARADLQKVEVLIKRINYKNFYSNIALNTVRAKAFRSQMMVEELEAFVKYGISRILFEKAHIII